MYEKKLKNKKIRFGKQQMNVLSALSKQTLANNGNIVWSEIDTSILMTSMRKLLIKRNMLTEHPKNIHHSSKNKYGMSIENIEKFVHNDRLSPYTLKRHYDKISIIRYELDLYHKGKKSHEKPQIVNNTEDKNVAFTNMERLYEYIELMDQMYDLKKQLLKDLDIQSESDFDTTIECLKKVKHCEN